VTTDQLRQATTREALTDGPWTRSVERALVLLETLGYSDSPLRLSSLARSTRLSKATVHRILRALVARDFVAKVGPGYTLGQRLLDLAVPADAAEAQGLARQLRPFLLELYEVTHGAVSFAILQHLQIRYSDLMHHRNHSPAPWRYGEAVPALHTAAGKLLLAYKPNVVSWLTSLEEMNLPDIGLGELNELLCELPPIRTRGLSCAYATNAPQELEIAAPVVGPDGRVLAALSVSGPADRLDVQTVAVHTPRIARAASAYLQRSSADLSVKQIGATPA
jgi:DNA-binding IclR family transcriptional regulator